ncbi:MAG: hypothetical protein M1826_006146 [Phylliscum demangeonii]|nr:MAG: hypothetical protein M1826_006146 [Phylliscum demangeonii]
MVKPAGESDDRPTPYDASQLAFARLDDDATMLGSAVVQASACISWDTESVRGGNSALDTDVIKEIKQHPAFGGKKWDENWSIEAIDLLCQDVAKKTRERQIIKIGPGDPARSIMDGKRALLALMIPRPVDDGLQAGDPDVLPMPDMWSDMHARPDRLA